MLQRLAGVLSMLHGLRKSKGEDVKETEQPMSVMPSKEELMAVYEGLRMSAYGNIIVKPETESAVEFLRQKGLVAIETEHFLDGTRGVMQRKYARWIGGWSCGDCVHGSTCEKNIGKEIWYHDTSFGRRCQRFMHKAIAEVLG